MKRLLVTAVVTFCMMTGAVRAAGISTPPPLVPWLAANHLFGYSDASGRFAIEPQYGDARPFESGFAVVAKDGRYGVVDTQGRVVVPLRYAVAKIFSVGRPGLALLVTKQEYDAPWRFWRWRWMPEFNLLGGGNHGPTVVTKVPRATWSVEWLPSRKTLYRHDGPDETGAMGTHRYWARDWVPDRALPQGLGLAVHGDLLQVNGDLWRIADDGRLTRLDMTAEGITPSGQLLVMDGKSYRLDSGKGKPIDGRVFTRQRKVSFDAPAGTFDVSQASDMGVAYPRIPYTIYQDQQGRDYLFPDFAKPLPRRVDDYHGAAVTIKANRIFSEAVAVWNLHHSAYFAVISTATGDTRRLFLLNRDGHWNIEVPLYANPHSLLSGGRISFEGAANRGVLDGNLRFHPLPLSYPVPCGQHPDWYMGKDVKTGKYGVFDAVHQRWQVPPAYDYLQEEIAPGVAVYSIVKKDTGGIRRDQFGLLDIAHDKQITPPRYDRLEENGRVVRQVGGKRLSFYIDRTTGFEYRGPVRP